MVLLAKVGFGHPRSKTHIGNNDTLKILCGSKSPYSEFIDPFDSPVTLSWVQLGRRLGLICRKCADAAERQLEETK